MPSYGVIVAVSFALALLILFPFSNQSNLWIHLLMHYQISILMLLVIGVVTPTLKVQQITSKAKILNS